MLYTANPILAGAAYGGVSTIVGQGLEKATGKNNRSWGEIATNTVGGTVGGAVGGATFMVTGNPILAGATGGGVATGTSELLQKAVGINDRTFVDIAKDSGKSAITGAIAGGVFGLAGKVTNFGGKSTPENIPNTPKVGGFDWNNVPHYNELLEQVGVPRTNLELPANVDAFAMKGYSEFSKTKTVVNVGEGASNAKGGSQAGDLVAYRRVQGGTPPNASQTRINVNSDGSINIPNKTANLNVSSGNADHANYFLNKRSGDANIVEFEVPKWFDDFVQESAIPQVGYKTNPLNQSGTVPKIVDITTPGTSYELPSPWIEWLEEYGTNGGIK